MWWEYSSHSRRTIYTECYYYCHLGSIAASHLVLNVDHKIMTKKKPKKIGECIKDRPIVNVLDFAFAFEIYSSTVSFCFSSILINRMCFSPHESTLNYHLVGEHMKYFHRRKGMWNSAGWELLFWWRIEIIWNGRFYKLSSSIFEVGWQLMEKQNQNIHSHTRKRYCFYTYSFLQLAQNRHVRWREIFSV